MKHFLARIINPKIGDIDLTYSDIIMDRGWTDVVSFRWSFNETPINPQVVIREWADLHKISIRRKHGQIVVRIPSIIGTMRYKYLAHEVDRISNTVTIHLVKQPDKNDKLRMSDRRWPCRGQRLDNGEMIEGSLLVSDNGRRCFIAESCRINPITSRVEIETYEVDPDTVGQSTGYHDKYGNRVYEDDVVRTESGCLCRVFWYDSAQGSGFELFPMEGRHQISDSTERPFGSENLEVLGNIYNNWDR